MHTFKYIHTFINTYIHTHNRGRFGATGSDLGNGMRKFVKAKKDFNIP